MFPLSHASRVVRGVVHIDKFDSFFLEEANRPSHLFLNARLVCCWEGRRERGSKAILFSGGDDPEGFPTRTTHEKETEHVLVSNCNQQEEKGEYNEKEQG